ncbi:hypothetical protein SAMN05216588_1232 [Pseudomonas flavescens]|uniref:Uncharacterized protein n=1 Tax=Phytopseudomonas flavescens TaxID=29435 RepID=A0A1G8MWS2_9GAMM|nr:hypothetical protein SAMN05216588_1232 [Pseudomonas flavescens]
MGIDIIQMTVAGIKVRQRLTMGSMDGLSLQTRIRSCIWIFIVIYEFSIIPSRGWMAQVYLGCKSLKICIIEYMDLFREA